MLRAVPGPSHRAGARLTRTVLRLDGAIEPTDLLLQRRELIEQGLQRPLHRWRKRTRVVFVRDDRGEFSDALASFLGDETEFGQMGPQRIDELDALADQEVTRAM